jgi:hypothetical protein
MAPRGNKHATGNKGGGRPRKFRAEYPKIALMLCERGATDFDLATAFSVVQSTIWRWTVDFPEFLESIEKGKTAFDRRVERSMGTRAIGYEYIAEKIMQYEGEVIRAEHMVHVPADVGAGKFWLEHRRPKEWGALQKHSGENGGDGGALARLYDAICGTKLMPNDDQTRYLEAPDAIEGEFEEVGPAAAYASDEQGDETTTPEQTS